MKKILLISLSLLFAGEMEVDGDLNVSGNIQSPTIEGLQAQIAALQSSGGSLETRIYQFPTYTVIPYQSEDLYFNLNEITGVELEFAWVKFISLNDYTAYNNQGDYYFGFEFHFGTEKRMVYSGNDFWANDCSIISADLKANNVPYVLSSASECFMYEHSRLHLNHGGNHGGGTYNFSIAVTADFSNVRINK